MENECDFWVIFFRLDFWSEIRSVYKLSMECMKPYAQKCISSEYSIYVRNDCMYAYTYYSMSFLYSLKIIHVVQYIYVFDPYVYNNRLIKKIIYFMCMLLLKMSKPPEFLNLEIFFDNSDLVCSSVIPMHTDVYTSLHGRHILYMDPFLGTAQLLASVRVWIDILMHCVLCVFPLYFHLHNVIKCIINSNTWLVIANSGNETLWLPTDAWLQCFKTLICLPFWYFIKWSKKQGI